MTPSFYIGRYPVWRIQEWEGQFAAPEDLFAEYDAAAFEDKAEDFTPAYYREGFIYAFLQSWLIDVGGLRILLDTGAGNDKDRPGIPVFGNLSTDFLAKLANTGFGVDDIDVVVNTHLHIDHVGWNTALNNTRWEPTFPKARYIFPRIDRQVWDPSGSQYQHMLGKDVNAQVFEDSVQPVLDAGLAELADDGYEITAGITLRDAPGHTPGHMLLEVRDGEDLAFFTGDILHHPMQVFRPDWNSVYCEDRETAARTRTMILKRAAREKARVVPAHFGGTHSVFVEERDGGFYPLGLS